MSRKSIDAIIEGINESKGVNEYNTRQLKGHREDINSLGSAIEGRVKDALKEFDRITNKLDNPTIESLDISDINKQMKQCTDSLQKSVQNLLRLDGMLEDIK